MPYQRKKPTKEQLRSLLNLYRRSNNGRSSFLAFRRSAKFAFFDDALMVQWCNMWIGIERDGYTHS